MTGLKDYLAVASEAYSLHFYRHGIGAHYVSQEMLDKPPPVGNRLLTIPQALARIGKAIEGDAWKDWERTALHFPQPVLAPKENIVDLLRESEKGAPVPPPVTTLTRGPRPTHKPDNYASRKLAWDEKKPERLAEAQAILELVSNEHRRWEEGAAAHAEGVTALHRAFTALANAISDDLVQPWFFSDGKKAPLPQEWVLRPQAENALVRTSRIYGPKGDDWGTALIPIEQLAPWLAGAEEGEDMPLSQPVDDWPYSQYLRLMMHVAREQRVRPDNQPPVSSLEFAIMAAAPKFGLEFSMVGPENNKRPERRVQSMAQVIRNPPPKK